MYSKITVQQIDAIIKRFEMARSMGATDPAHAAAIAARDVLCKTDRQWDGKHGSEAYAAALTTLVHNKKIKVGWVEEEVPHQTHNEKILSMS